MGLDTTHNCWHGSYGNFHLWRTELCKAAGYPPLHTMDGFTDISYDGVINSWEPYEDDILTELLCHSDCDGYLHFSICDELADRLEELLPKIEEGWHYKTQCFIDGLRAAAEEKEDVLFR